MVSSIQGKGLPEDNRGIVLLSDSHLTVLQPIGRLDNYPETLTNKFLYVCNWAFDMFGKRAIILQAGDFSDVCRSWNLLSHLITVLAPLAEMFDSPPIYTIFGQHDTYMYSEKTRDKTVLGILDLSSYVRILSANPVYFLFNDRHVAVYGASIGEKVPKVKDKKDLNILVIHRMIGMTAAYKGQNDFDYAPSFLAKHKDYDVILTGDLHRKFLYTKDGRTILNSGPLGRSNVSDEIYSHKPGFFVYYPNTNEFSYEIIPHKKAEEVLSREHIDRKKEVKTKVDNFIQFISRIRNDRNSRYGSVQFLDILMDYLVKESIEEDVVNLITEIAGEDLSNARKIRGASNRGGREDKEVKIWYRSEDRGKELDNENVKKGIRTKLY
jgi:DNA repair protein SbcD/Mre11